MQTPQEKIAAMRSMDEAFEAYRKEKFGAYAEYPIEAYTHFAAGWKAAIEQSLNIALAIDSNRGNEKEIAKAIRSA